MKIAGRSGTARGAFVESKSLARPWYIDVALVRFETTLQFPVTLRLLELSSVVARGAVGESRGRWWSSAVAAVGEAAESGFGNAGRRARSSKES